MKTEIVIDNNDYEYKGLLARSWDFQRGDTSTFPDRQLPREVIERSGEPALDVGCGTGRLLLEYRAAGLDVDGVDNSPDMLAICRQKASEQSLDVTVYNQTMETLNLPRRYRTIIVPSYSFQLVTDVAAAKKTLDGFYKHLLPGGTLFMTIWHTIGDGTGQWGEWWLVFEGEGFENGLGLKRWERSRFDPNTQLRHTENRYELTENGEVVFTERHCRSPELRSYSLSQITNLLAESGFSDIQAVSGYSSKPATADDKYFCLFGVRN